MKIFYYISLFVLIPISTGWANGWPELSFVKIAEGLDQPVHMIHAGDNTGRLFVVEQPGRIKILQHGQVQEALFLDITERVSSGGERGLLSMAFPPRFSEKKYFYLNYTDRSGNTRISRFYMAENTDIADKQSEEIILTIEQPFTNHNGGQLAFGLDGFLYIGTGDGGSGGDPQGSGQNSNTLLGKMLRIDTESGVKPYSIPDTNPFITTPDFRPEIWALGLRNPWRFSFDREEGDLYIADVGQNLYEEINVQQADSSGGENYGWNIMEGLHCFSRLNCNQTGLTAPVLEYVHSAGDVSVTGGFVYRGKQFPEMQGIYFFADYVSGRVGGLRWKNGAWDSAVLAETNFNISSFAEDGTGEIYLLDLTGAIYRVEEKNSNQLQFNGLLAQYNSGDSLQVFIQEPSSKPSSIVDLWVALQLPEGTFLYLTGHSDQPFASQPVPFVSQVGSDAIRHQVLDIDIPDGVVKGTYTFYAIYNAHGADLGNLADTARSSIVKEEIAIISFD